MNTLDIMIDLETLGTCDNAAIVAIGATVFDFHKGVVTLKDFYTTIDLVKTPPVQRGVIDPDTVMWWMRQSDEARKALTRNPVPLEDALKSLAEFITITKDAYQSNSVCVWGNGATFDMVLLRNAYNRCNMEAPWHYYNERDVRTVVDIGRRLLNVDFKESIKFKGTKHNAKNDAVYQAQYVCELSRHLKMLSL